MAKKRVHEIAKEQGMSSSDVLVKLRAAGLEVTAAASTVEEDEALRALRSNGSGAKAAAKPAAPAQRAAAAGARTAPPRQAAAPPAAEPAAPQRARRIFEPDGPPLQLPSRQQDDRGIPQAPPPRPRQAPPAPPRPPAPARPQP
ncbi:MAG TPA: translation initiation factor IF-2 N-terminal domain-containing protein, partial [Solirubrobacteraceae bacterium]|nr:translation initiation factor IF-2 N-terminal domain-containing protein [Solirubrobacteraceae bacterium]